MSIFIRHCPLCGSTDTGKIVSRRDYDTKNTEEFIISKCNHCSALYLYNRPDEHELNKFYDKDYQPYELKYNSLVEKFIKYRTERELKKFRKVKPDSKSLLDIGASWGKYLLVARDNGFNVAGIEMSEEMADTGRIKHNLDISAGTLENVRYPDNTFDVVVMNHVIEHLYDPAGSVKEIHRILKPGGIFYIRTPNAQTIERKIFGKYWFSYEVPRHIVIFSTKTLPELLRKSGFEIQHLSTEKTPNNIIQSTKNFVGEQALLSWMKPFWSIKNPVLLIGLLPISYIAGLLGQSGRQVILATKKHG